ncbi:MAG TPA: YncE family protein [Kofleriaceae bacterium]|jgi:DNA-binding beta-propeller fold protein YncE|nr:YncE family protein [Kofleriaceae bacterium]
MATEHGQHAVRFRPRKPAASRRWLRGPAVALAAGSLILVFAAGTPAATLSVSFTRHILAPVGPEPPLALRLFSTPVKTDSRGSVITGQTSDPVKNIVGAEAAGTRAGFARYTKIMFGAQYDTGRPNDSHRIDPNHPSLSSGSEHWPFRSQPFRSWPGAVAVTPDGAKLYVALPGREGYPDFRVAVVNTTSKTVTRWVDLRPSGQTLATRPIGLGVSPVNPAISANPYVVVLHEYANFASVIDTSTDTVLGEFETDFYAEDLVFNTAGTRLYTTDRFNHQVRAFRIDPGPTFTALGTIATGTNDLDRSHPRDLALSSDGNTLYVANTLGHTVAVINVANDANTLVRTMPVGGLVTDVKIAGRWGIVSGHDTSNVMNGPETGHGLPTVNNGVAIRNNGQPLGYQPVMTDATKATTFDDIGSTLSIFDAATNQFVYRYVDVSRDQSLLVTPGQAVDLGDHEAGSKIIRGSGPEQIWVKGSFAFVAEMHSDKVEVFRVDQNPVSPSGILTAAGFEFTGGITPQAITVSPDGQTVYVANMQTEDVSFLHVDGSGALTRQGLVAVGVTGSTPDPTKSGGGTGTPLFSTDEEIGLRWFFTQSYSDDGQKSCGHCHWQSRHDGSQWNVGANAIGGVKAVPQNKDLADNWPEWFEGLNNNMTAYASACNGELVQAERVTALFPQPSLSDRLAARDAFVLDATAANSAAINRAELRGDARSIGYNKMAFDQILWTQNETRRLPNPRTQFPSASDAAQISRGRQIFTSEVSAGGAGCASCHHNGDQTIDGSPNDSFQDYNIHEPGVVSETTIDGDGPFKRLTADYFFIQGGPPADEGSRQNISSRNTRHLRSFWDGVPRWLHHGFAHSVREILLGPDSPLLRPGERGFNFRTVRTDATRRVAADFLGGPAVILPTEVPIAIADSSGTLGGDGRGPILVSLDAPTQVAAPDVAYPDGRLLVDQIGTSNLAPIIVVSNGQRQVNPVLATNHIQVIKDTHGKTSQLSQSDLDALIAYVMSLQ